MHAKHTKKPVRRSCFDNVVAFSLFLFVTGHDADERTLTLIEWAIGGLLIGSEFGYLVKWRRLRDRS